MRRNKRAQVHQVETKQYPWRDRFWTWAYKHDIGRDMLILIPVLELIVVGYGLGVLHRLYPDYTPPTWLALLGSIGFTVMITGTQMLLAKDLRRFRGDKPW